ncbi:MAG: ATPase [Oligoflexia bacterium]|nr:ATPase [Oligoflexia bacterium]
MFIGRGRELKLLNGLLKKNTATLIAITGRRRIGKSSLLIKFGQQKEFKKYIHLQGLAPRPELSYREQLQHIRKELKVKYKLSKIPEFNSWLEVFFYLNDKFNAKGRTLLVLDEISWMAHGYPEFAGELKVAWDDAFKSNSQLILAICGSVSSWIEDNILKKTDFVGRISLSLRVDELALDDTSLFWGKNHSKISSYEKLKILAITGGVPLYLEEMIVSDSAESNIARLCFDESGLLYREFDQIFNEIFQKDGEIYKEILQVLTKNKLAAIDIAKKLKYPFNGDFSNYLSKLESASFIQRDYFFDLQGNISSLSRYRIKDNYLRFYLSYILPNKIKIKQGQLAIKTLDQLLNWNTILGLQFENLLLSNLPSIYNKIGIPLTSVQYAGPYVQKHNSKTKGACQIDLLIYTKEKVLYVCEMKCKAHVDSSVIKEVEKKISVLRIPRQTSIRTVLIYESDVSERAKEQLLAYFTHLIPFVQLL